MLDYKKKPGKFSFPDQNFSRLTGMAKSTTTTIGFIQFFYYFQLGYRYFLKDELSDPLS